MSKIPLSERMRPRSLQDVVGQRHLVGPKGVIRRMVEQRSLPSLILWGPPGVGKTTLAQLLAQQMQRPFRTLSAISAGVKDIREVIDLAAKQPGLILFIDEIHRFNKGQQDALLGAVERGIITLVGATTENPSFEVNAALLSRCQVYTLKPLEEGELRALVGKALEQDAQLAARGVQVQEYDALLHLSGGDARRLLNLLEQVVEQLDGEQPLITNALVTAVAQQKSARYDKGGEMHYDIISAFIKSIRGSDPNGAVYWLARMLEGGEDPKFIARRLVIAASEDIGNANPTALVIAANCFQAVTYVGMPEARIILSQATTYLACSPKSNAAYVAINQAMQLVRETGDLPVPLHLRNAPTKLMKQAGYGKDYQYPHDHPGNFALQQYMPDALKHHRLFEPGANAREEEMRRRLRALWANYYAY